MVVNSCSISSVCSLGAVLEFSELCSMFCNVFLCELGNNLGGCSCFWPAMKHSVKAVRTGCHALRVGMCCLILLSHSMYIFFTNVLLLSRSLLSTFARARSTLPWWEASVRPPSADRVRGRGSISRRRISGSLGPAGKHLWRGRVGRWAASGVPWRQGKRVGKQRRGNPRRHVSKAIERASSGGGIDLVPVQRGGIWVVQTVDSR
jgi:hypothetical protein